ncbi:hypothetical protein BG842_12080 [Haladaptatus sp. W1]|uniref:SIR2 family protein n=1 Tax=Haladaptatus sp. W1 TaxID=1897478 RepID=UPI0008499BF2|nr:SIR2 family protein [Haladaptatus sp. W1]ODR80092.1 hypothetical protein BG842_12080 [Haladaptatus sp. W1]
MTRTYILGAGASLGYNDDAPDDLIPPGTNDFFAKGAKSGLLFDDDFQELSEAVIEYEGIDDDLENIDFEDLDLDVEEFLQYLHESMESVSSEFTSMEKYQRYQGAISSVYFFIYEILRSYKLGLSPENNNYVKLARDYLNQPYNVISLNYDLLFEYAIEYANLDYHYQSHHWEWEPNIPIAKIHGSINWINEFEDMFVGDRPFSEKIQAVHTFTSNKSEHILTNEEVETNSYRDLVFNLKKPQSIPSYSEFIHTNYIDFSPNVATFLYEPSIIPPLAWIKTMTK